MNNEELASEIQNLKRSNRLMIAIICAMTLVYFLGGPMLNRFINKAESSQFRELKIVNDDGYPVITLGSSDSDGSGMIVLTDNRGQIMSKLSALGNVSGVFDVYNASGEKIITLAPNPNGSGSIELFTDAGNRLVSIGADHMNNGALGIFAEKGNPLVSIASDPQGNGIILRHSSDSDDE